MPYIRLDKLDNGDPEVIEVSEDGHVTDRRPQTVNPAGEGQSQQTGI